jgi:acyl carrier protein
MAQIDDPAGESGQTLPTPPQSRAPINDDALQDALKRCSPATVEAARLYRSTGNAEHVQTIVRGVVARFVEPNQRARLAGPTENLRLSEDLGLDSLTLMELVMFAEDVLPISIDNNKLTHVRTLGDLQRLIADALPRSPAESLNGGLGPRGIPHFPAPDIALRSPAEYHRLAGLSLRPKRLAAESRDRPG